MPRFAYSAIDRSGSMVKGEVSAPTEIAAMDRLGRQGLTPVSLDEGGSADPWWQRDIAFSASSKHLKPADQQKFFSTLETMLASGFTLPRSLAFVAEQARDRKVSRVLTSLTDNVAAGATLTQAMAETDSFPSRILELVRTGEAANQLPLVAANISGMLASEMQNARQIRQALIYPAILLAMSVLVLLMLVFFLAPTLVPVFHSANVTPPVLLATLDAIGKSLRENWMAVVIGTLSGVLAVLVSRERIGTLSRAILALVPGVRSYSNSRETLRFLKTLQLMLASGAQIPVALEAAGNAASSAKWKSGIEDIRSRVEAGDSLSAALRTTSLADPGTLSFVEAGEEGDRMAEMLARACQFLDDQTREQLAAALRLITPVLTLVIGLTVGVLIFTTIGAILDLNDLAT